MTKKQIKRLKEINEILHNERDWKKIDSHSLIMERSELEFKRNSQNINFSIARGGVNGCNKYYYAAQCHQFTKNLLKHGYNGFNNATREEIEKEGVCFNKYSINVGYSQYCKDLKRFNSKEEMFGFVIGYNEAVNNSKAI